MSKLQDIIKLNYSEISKNVKAGTGEFPKTEADLKALMFDISQDVADKYAYRQDISLEAKAELCNLFRDAINQL